LPVRPFQEYILEQRVPSDHHHYYSAYPDASATMVKQGLELRAAIEDLTARARDLEPSDFHEAYQQLLMHAQTV
jgi:hypothetical protein